MELNDRSTIWPYDERGEPSEFFYTRYAHPAGAAAEAKLGELEGGEALLFASGMAAETAVVLAFARPGLKIALAEGAYFGTSVLFRTLEPWGLEFVEYDQTGPTPDGVEIVWVESPANPTLTTPDWEALRDWKAAGDSNAGTGPPRLIVCDATVATPIYLRSLDEGADIAIHSGTKFLTGNHGALLGAAVTRDPERRKVLHHLRTQTGSVASPHSAAALVAGLDSLPGRMRHITESSTELARRLDRHPAVKLVRYPGYSGLISFDVADPRRVETSTRVIMNATSLGGVTSTMESRHRWEGDRIPTGLLRLSVGLEDVDELWADLEEALA